MLILTNDSSITLKDHLFSFVSAPIGTISSTLPLQWVGPGAVVKSKIGFQ